MQMVRSISQIPAALAANNIVAAHAATANTAFPLASRSVGVERNIPIIAYGSGGIANGTPTTAAIALDFGFAWGTVVAANKTVTVASSLDFVVGMPLVIAGVGNAGGTAPLLTNVASLASPTTITIMDAPAASLNPAPIGTGNLWGPSPGSSQNMYKTPTAALPWWAGGPGLWLDGRQAIGRNIRAVGPTNGVGGHVTILGWDVYGVPMSETLTVAAGSNTVYGVKAFKYISSVTPDFDDASHTYTIGTGDVFGFNYRCPAWDDSEVMWEATLMTTSTGYVAPLSLATTSSATTADVRGTIQVSSAGAGSPLTAANASNGTVSALAMSGRRLMMRQVIGPIQAIAAKPADARALFGQTQA